MATTAHSYGSALHMHASLQTASKASSRGISSHAHAALLSLAPERGFLQLLRPLLALEGLAVPLSNHPNAVSVGGFVKQLVPHVTRQQRRIPNEDTPAYGGCAMEWSHQQMLRVHLLFFLCLLTENISMSPCLGSKPGRQHCSEPTWRPQSPPKSAASDGLRAHGLCV